jgi:nucleotide-binding universal stress UspA family protein
VPYGFGPAYTSYPYQPDVETSAARSYLDQTAVPLRAAGSDVDVHAEIGLVAATLARLARERRVEAIAMATHGRSGVARGVLGSVATGVIRLAHVPVLVARPAALPRTPRFSEAAAVGPA